MKKIFLSYAHEDEALHDELAKHLALLKRQSVIEGWHDREITAGSDWGHEIDKNLEDAEIVILLVSADFLASDYCWDVEVKRSLEMHEANQAKVIPVILRRCDWKSAPFAKLQALPTDARPVTDWPDRDEAWTRVALGIRSVVS